MQAFAWGEIVATLQDLKEGLPACIPNYDFVTSSRQAEATAVDSADVILFDGILAFYSAGTPTVPFLLPQRRQRAFCLHPLLLTDCCRALAESQRWRLDAVAVEGHNSLAI